MTICIPVFTFYYCTMYRMCLVENNPSLKLQSHLKRIDGIVHAVINLDNGVLPKWNRTFTEFSEFRKSDNHWSMDWVRFKDPVSNVSWWHCGSILVSTTGDGRFKSFECTDTYFCHRIQRIQWKHLGTTPNGNGTQVPCRSDKDLMLNGLISFCAYLR